MRLIDADKIRYSDMSDGQVPKGVWLAWKDEIDEMPTVEAIPIKWLKKKIESFYRISTNVSESVERAYIDRARHLEDLLEDWRLGL